jgi:hypothetical protein
MKRWLSRDTTKVKLGVAFLAVFCVTATIAAAGGQRSASELSRNSSIANAPVEQVALSEKPKIAVTQTNIVTTEEEIPFATTQTYDGTLPKDATVVRVEGSKGKKIIRTEVKTKNGVEVSRALISEEVTVPPVAKLIAIGTKVVAERQSALAPGECDLHYTPCIRKTGKDLDCKDIGFRVHIVMAGEDPHGFDGDADGEGCESYPEHVPQSRGIDQ